MIVNPKSELIREPNLLVPGIQPISPQSMLRVNQAHPLAKDLKVLFKLDGTSAPIADLTGNATFPHPVGQLWNFGRASTPYGMGTYHSGLTTSRSYVITQPFANEVTIYQRVIPYTLVDNTSVSDADPTNTYRHWRLTLNSSGQWSNLFWNGINGIASSNTAGANELHKVWSLASDIKDEIKIRLNGVETVYGSAWTSTLVNQTMFIMGTNRNTTITGVIFCFFMWNRYLSTEEMDVIDADPYQFLIPA